MALQSVLHGPLNSSEEAIDDVIRVEGEHAQMTISELSGPVILRLAAVEAKTGLPCSSIYELIGQQLFPEPVGLSKRRVGWIEQEINQWIEARIAARDAMALGVPRQQRKLHKASEDAPTPRPNKQSDKQSIERRKLRKAR
jgi:prophage regulatory protein